MTEFIQCSEVEVRSLIAGTHSRIAPPGQEGWLRDQENAALATETAQTGWWLKIERV